METELDRELDKAQAALLARYAPETQIRRIRWSQGETQVVELGTGAPLLYVHGGLSTAFEIAPILRALAENHRVLAVDRPGHGLADPFDYRGIDLLDHGRTFLRDILDALELPTVDVLANSMGALLVRRLRARRSRPRVAHRARRRAVRDHAKAAPPDACARTPLHRADGSAGTYSRLRRGTGAGSSGASSSSSIQSDSTTCCSTSTSRTRDGTSRAGSA